MNQKVIEKNVYEEKEKKDELVGVKGQMERFRKTEG